jgi:DnaJ-class molecular chaperone
MQQSCAFCKGTGNNPHFKGTCPVCKGEGRNQITGKYMTCGDCHGSGQKRGTTLTCYTCTGLGVVPDTRQELKEAKQEIRKIRQAMEEEIAQLTAKEP